MMFHQSHFLVPVGLTGDLYPSLSLAIEMARERGGRVSLLHVHQGSWPKYEGLDAIRYLYAVLDLPLARQRERQIREDLERLLGTIPLSWHRPLRLRALIRTGDVAEEILNVAREENASTILLDVRPRRWWWSRRCITEQLLRAAPCRVLLVRPPSPTARVLSGAWNLPRATDASAPRDAGFEPSVRSHHFQSIA